MNTPTIAATTTPPRIRWAAIIWGLLFGAIATTTLWILADSGRRDAIGDFIVNLTPTTIVTILLLTGGVLMLIGGAAGLARRAQRELATAVSASQREEADPLAE